MNSKPEMYVIGDLLISDSNGHTKISTNCTFSYAVFSAIIDTTVQCHCETDRNLKVELMCLLAAARGHVFTC